MTACVGGGEGGAGKSACHAKLYGRGIDIPGDCNVKYTWGLFWRIGDVSRRVVDVNDVDDDVNLFVKDTQQLDYRVSLYSLSSFFSLSLFFFFFFSLSIPSAACLVNVFMCAHSIYCRSTAPSIRAGQGHAAPLAAHTERKQQKKKKESKIEKKKKKKKSLVDGRESLAGHYTTYT